MQMNYISMKQLQKKRGDVGRNAVYTDVENGILPRPLKIGRRIFWIEEEVDTAMALEVERSRSAA